MDIDDETRPDERYWKDRLREDHPGERLSEAILEALRLYDHILLAIVQRAVNLMTRARRERSVARREITRRHKAINGAHAKVETSKRILYVRERLEGLELIWKAVIYPKVYDPRFKPKGWLRDVGAMRKSGVDLRHVAKGAHPDEVALLTRHEMEAREIRGLWKQTKKAEGRLKELGKRVLKLLDEEAAANSD